MPFMFIFYILRNFDWWWKKKKCKTMRNGKSRENYSEKTIIERVIKEQTKKYSVWKKAKKYLWVLKNSIFISGKKKLFQDFFFLIRVVQHKPWKFMFLDTNIFYKKNWN